jgi:hypothetical protein
LNQGQQSKAARLADSYGPEQPRSARRCGPGACPAPDILPPFHRRPPVRRSRKGPVSCRSLTPRMDAIIGPLRSGGKVYPARARRGWGNRWALRRSEQTDGCILATTAVDRSIGLPGTESDAISAEISRAIRCYAHSSRGGRETEFHESRACHARASETG